MEKLAITYETQIEQLKALLENAGEIQFDWLKYIDLCCDAAKTQNLITKKCNNGI